ncbi:uncharacterized protein LOC128864687 [Anastrepha ludens]|uniref:uncharacterized protein LOC128864687 n=1 Tax=Anastrepha ludens TaxID=28586 RepID=UPI0023B13A6F|nr:uncharacterized protein LOC128864687 [Anastrepha ludens]
MATPVSKATTPASVADQQRVSDTGTAVGVVDLPSAPVAEGVTTRASSAARQEVMFQAMQKRIAALERSLKVAQDKIREHELTNEAQRADAQSIASAPSDSSANESALPSSSLPMTQIQLLQPQSPLITCAATCVHTVQPPPPQNATRYQMYTATRSSPLIYTSSTNGTYSSSTLPPGDTFVSSLPSTVPISANVGSLPLQFSTQPRKLQDLPEFSGKPEDWPIFFTAYTESTTVYGYSRFENNLRLQKCLKGEAREAVKSLLIHPNNVANIIEQLKFRFGRPEQLIRSQLAHVREIAPISESSVVKLIPFATKISNVCAFLRSACGGEQYLVNPTLLDELVGKLPMSKRIEWAVFASSLQPYATVQHFSDWLTQLANVICTVYDGEAAKDSKRRVVLHAAESQRHSACPICQGQHKPADCTQFSQLTVPERWEEVKRRHLCFSCLNVGHGSRNCQRRKLCSTDGCKRWHHKLLHDIGKIIDGSSNQSPRPRDRQRRTSIADTHTGISTRTQPASRIEQQGDAGATVLSCSTDNNSKLLFRILPVVLYGNQKPVETYALLDEGSSITMIDSTLIEELGLRGQTERLNLQWFGGRAAQESAMVVDLLVSGAGMQKRHKLRRVYGVSNLQLPSQSLNKSDLRCHESQLNKLAVEPYAQVKPKLLIGLDHCHLGLPSTTMQLNKCGPFAANTELGWAVFGPTMNSDPSLPSCLFVNCHTDQSLHNMVAEYFETESFGVRAAPIMESEADVRAREILKSTTCRVEGRYQTGLLWKRSDIQLPASYSMALKRLAGVEAKMRRDTDFAAEYNRIISSYVMKDYARKLSPEEAALTCNRTWCLPHFAVKNPNKPGKLRMVFDAAAEVDGVSLNSQLMKGPQEYRSLPAILFHFREGATGVCGDIKEMFHQVLVQRDDRCAQRFLWRQGDTTRQPEVYEMRVMTFGAACSPCAANYVKTINALEYGNKVKGATRAVKSILDYHYVDDYVDSFDTEEEAADITKQVRAIHKMAGFDLCNFASNSLRVTEALSGDGNIRQIANKEGVLVGRVLGLFWQASTDTFGFKLRFNNVDSNVLDGGRRPTKRELLSVVMSIFDPLGFLSNFVVSAKILMREVWKNDIRWDEPLPNNVNTAWEGWRKQLPMVAEYTVPRYYYRNGKPEVLQLHVFVDASEDAFAAVAYWRSTNAAGEVEVAFISAKTKCAPMKSLTVPRLELQAAVLGTRLLNCLREEHSLHIDDCVIWSDSKTVIQWLRSEHRRYKPFVQHRIAEILATTTTANWRWLPIEHNVADEATRANNFVDFSSSARWSCGPPFLLREEQYWPTESSTCNHHEEADKELRPKFALAIVSCTFLDYNRFSTFSKLVRTTAWVLRFIDVCRRRKPPDQGYGLTAKEVETAKLCLCRLVQRGEYAEEFQHIESGLNLPRTSSLIQLSPYIDEDGVLRVRGRIEAASWLPISARRPIILPPKHCFSNLVAMHYHVKMHHQNLEATICEIRRLYWIPRLRSLLRSIVANCAICRLRKIHAVSPLMGPLPIDRLTPYVRPFSYTGLDYFGPITVTVRRANEKRWVALFTCLTVRAVHLELAHDLSTDSCIIVLRNFINRRGVPVRVRSDNGKNFVGADMEAKCFSEVFDWQFWTLMMVNRVDSRRRECCGPLISCKNIGNP